MKDNQPINKTIKQKLVGYRKVLLTAVLSMAVTAIGSAAKAYVDVQKLKVEMTSIVDLVRETREDVRVIKFYLLNKEK